MNKDVLFRGKTKNGDEWVWVYGFFLTHTVDKKPFHYSERKCYILTPQELRECYEFGDLLRSCKITEVVPETIGQYSQIYDRYGIRICEGDIVKILYSGWSAEGKKDTQELARYLWDMAEVGVVTMTEFDGYSVLIDNIPCPLDFGKHGFVEVIGNIWDNPELLKGGDKK